MERHGELPAAWGIPESSPTLSRVKAAQACVHLVGILSVNAAVEIGMSKAAHERTQNHI